MSLERVAKVRMYKGEQPALLFIFFQYFYKVCSIPDESKIFTANSQLYITHSIISYSITSTDNKQCG